MIKTFAPTENIFQRRIGAKFYGVFTKVIIHTNFIVKQAKSLLIGRTLLLVKGGLSSVKGTLGLVKGGLLSVKGTLPLVKGGLLSVKGTLPLVKGTLLSVKGTLLLVKGTLSLAKGSLIILNSVFVYINTIIQILKSKLHLIFIRKVLNIKYSIYNVKGFHFNLEFINYLILKQRLIIFKLLFNRKHQYWYESNYFS